MKGKHIIIGISGGIAAYKIPSLIRLCKKAGAEVKIVATKNALQFVTPLTLQSLSDNCVYSDVFADHNAQATEHISLSDWGDIMVIAPATANIIGKMANGIADDALSTEFLAFCKPVIIAPAMNHNMLHHPATMRNMHLLSQMPLVRVLGTGFGELACHTNGDGRMLEPEQIFAVIEQQSEPQDLLGKKVLITAGPTQEAIDPVRFISNYSTGKMGYALANECANRGADVILVSGPTCLNISHPNINRIDVVSAKEMHDVAVSRFAEADIVILCAAVADFTPAKVADKKIKREKDNLCIELQPTCDIAAELGKQKTTQTIIGFALETNNEQNNAIEKLKRKNFDYIVLNSLQDEGAGFGYDTNRVTIYGADGFQQAYSLKSKTEVAADIINCVLHK